MFVGLLLWLVWVPWEVRCVDSRGFLMPWADVRRNPCAVLPQGWLMLYWPTDGNCYTIYKQGYPCPENQELSPIRGSIRVAAECRCAPGWAQLPRSPRCHKLFESGPCRPGEYFAPVEETFNNRGERKGICVRPRRCSDDTQVFWPAERRCHWRRSQGPCNGGTLLDADLHGLANCTCEKGGDNYWEEDGRCYEYYTRGPCAQGQLFLPGPRCGCPMHLPHYHNNTQACYELDSVGPCPKGHTFSITQTTALGPRVECICKLFHVQAMDGACYRLYTRGPCDEDEMITQGGRCIKLPCSRGRLYLPERRRCYRPGSAEPCSGGDVVAFDFEAKPAVDGLSHNGVCSCGHASCERKTEASCKARKGTVPINGACHTIHTQGPCREGAWVEADESGNGRCVCMIGRDPPNCYAPVVRLANYLNAIVRAKPLS